MAQVATPTAQSDMQPAHLHTEVEALGDVQRVCARVIQFFMFYKLEEPEHTEHSHAPKGSYAGICDQTDPPDRQTRRLEFDLPVVEYVYPVQNPWGLFPIHKPERRHQEGHVQHSGRGQDGILQPDPLIVGESIPEANEDGLSQCKEGADEHKGPEGSVV